MRGKGSYAASCLTAPARNFELSFVLFTLAAATTTASRIGGGDGEGEKKTQERESSQHVYRSVQQRLVHPTKSVA